MENSIFSAGDKMFSENMSAPTKPFPRDEYASRIERTVESVRKKNLDAMILLNDINRKYLTGLTSTSGVLVVHAGLPPALYTDFRYFEAASRQIGFMDVRLMKGPDDAFKDISRRYKAKRIGYEGAIQVQQLDALRKNIGSAGKWVESGNILQDLRSIKSKLEQEIMRKAARLNDVAYANVLTRLKPGMTEWKIKCRIRAECDRLGQGEASPCIVCAGANSSRCHHKPSLDRTAEGKALLIDMGIKVNDYLTDMTRTVFFGKPSSEMRKIYEIVLQANMKAIEMIRPGVACRKVDMVARKIIADAGYGKFFGHGLGHSVGLEIHEEPRFSQKSTKTLEAGMVMTVEPGIYLPDAGGVRIEDLVLVTDTGCEILSSTPKKLICL